MTLEERSQLSRFLQLLTQGNPGVKDAEAEALIADAVRRQPDAAYLLVQRVLQLEHALLEATTKKPAFVGDPNAWGRPAAAAQAGPQAAYQSPLSQPSGEARPSSPLMQPAAGRVAQPSAWGSGLMGTVASTAVGVVAGSLLAQGIGSLFGHGGAQAATPKDSHATDSSAVPPGGGTLVETDYGAQAGSEEDYVAGDFDTSADSGDFGDTV
jgi:hypothetical protein